MENFLLGLHEVDLSTMIIKLIIGLIIISSCFDKQIYVIWMIYAMTFIDIMKQNGVISMGMGT